MDEAAPETAIRRRPIAWRRWLPRAVFESLLIVFSVVLALGLTALWEDRQDARRAEEMRAYLVAEIRGNRERLVGGGYIARHETLKRAFAEAGGTPDAVVTRVTASPAIEELFGNGGLRLFSQQNAVWVSVSSSDLFQHMDPEEVFMLARLYRAQESLTSLNRAGYDTALGLLNILSDESGAHREMMRMTLFMEDLLVQERQLLALYDAALVELGDPAASRADDGAAPTG
jgi:hypothetical protein